MELQEEIDTVSAELLEMDRSDIGRAEKLNQLTVLLAQKDGQPPPTEETMPEIKHNAAVGQEHLDGAILSASEVPARLEDVDVMSALPDGAEVDPEAAARWSEWAYSLEAPQVTIDALVKDYARYAELDEAQIDAEYTATKQTLEQRYGENLDRALHLAYSVAHSIGGQQLVDELEATGFGNSYFLIQTLIDTAERKGHLVNAG